jgi:hypothetical protein
MAPRRPFAALPFVRRTFILTALLGSALLSACGGGGDDAAAPPAAAASQVTVGGGVQNPTSYSATQLKAAAAPSGAASSLAVSQSVRYTSGSVTEDHSYNGVSLWGLLNASNIQVGAAKNDILRKYVVAKGVDGYRAVFSMGELHEFFGNRGNILAFEETTSGAPVLMADLRLTSPGDKRGGRYVSLLRSLDIQSSASTQTGTGGGLSTQFTVSGLVKTPGSYDLAALQGLAQVTRTAGGRGFTGVDLWNFLNVTAGGLVTDPAVKNDFLSFYIVATGSDGYQTVIAIGEIEPNFGAQPNLIAWDENSTGNVGTAGFARFVVPGDVRAGRWVSNLVSIEVFKAPL